MSEQVWFITGASSGFGLELALAVAATDAAAIATVRSRSKSADAVERLENAGVRVIEFDASADAATVKGVAKKAVSIHGRVDVLVNNAGYSIVGAVEDFSEKEAQTLFATNYFGPLWLMQAVLPSMRERKAGTIVNVTSIAGVVGLPSCGMYAGTKWALEGTSEALAREVAPFNIRVLIVEPGAFRTKFLSKLVKAASGLTPAYNDGPVGKTLQMFGEVDGKQPGDPVKGAKAIVDVVNAGCKVKGEQVLRLPLGSDCVGRINQEMKIREHDIQACDEIAHSTDY